MSVMVIVLGLVVGVAYWFAREEQKTIERIPPEEMDEKERQARRERESQCRNVSGEVFADGGTSFAQPFGARW